LIRAPLSTTSVLDEAADSVRTVASPWAAVLILTSLPYRFAQVVFTERLLRLGADASRYVNYLSFLATISMFAFVLSRWGRLVFARAVRLAIENGESPGREAWRIKPAVFLNYLYMSAFTELVSIATMVTCLASVCCTMLAGLAIGTAELNDHPSIVAPFRSVAKYRKTFRIVIALMLVFGCALAVAAINVGVAFGIGLWLAKSIQGWDAARWTLLLDPNNRRFMLVIIAGAVIAVEPFWIAAHVTFVRKTGAEQTGDDLRAWFEELRDA